MRIEVTGGYKIQSKNNEVKTFELLDIGWSSFDVNDYMVDFDFDYGLIFENVMKNTNKEGYPIPTNKDEFNQSKIWNDLGFNTANDFEIRFIGKWVELEHYMTHGQKGAYLIDFDTMTINLDKTCLVNNELDNLIFEDWGVVYDSEGGEAYRGDIIENLVSIFSKYYGENANKDSIEIDLREYFENLKREDDEPISEEDIDSVLQIMISQL